MEHGPLELLARLVHVGATGDAGERVPWAELSTGQRDAMTSEAVAVLSGLGRASYPTNPEGLTAPEDLAAAAKVQIDGWERGGMTTGETMARSMPLVMALMRSGSERAS
jgi:hypothetical protein